jgi:hypothetical protein
MCHDADMARKTISSSEFGARIQKLMTDAVPLLVVFATGNGMVARLFGFLSRANAESGLLFSRDREVPTASDTLSVIVLAGSEFFLESVAELPDPNSERERLGLRYGDSCLAIDFPSDGRLMMFFTALSS